MEADGRAIIVHLSAGVIGAALVPAKEQRTIPLESKSPSWEERPLHPNQPASQLIAHSVTPLLRHSCTC